MLKYPTLLTALCVSTMLLAQKAKPVKQGNKSHTDVATVEYLPEFTREVPAESGSVFKIKNKRYNLEIRLWDQKKVRIVSTVPMGSDTDTLTNDELYKMSGVTLSAFGKRIDLASDEYPENRVAEVTNIQVQGLPAQPAKNRQDANGAEEIVVEGYKTTTKKQQANVGEVTVVGYKKGGTDSSGKTPSAFPNRPVKDEPASIYGTQNPQVADVVVTGYKSTWTRTSSTRRNMVVYIPRDCKLVVDNRYTDIVVNEDLDKAEFTLYRSNLGLRNVNELRVDASFYTMYAGNLGYADLKLASGSLTAGTIDNAQIESTGSEVEYEGGNTLFLKSKADRINVENVGSVGGYKEFGELRIGKLSQDLTLEGKSTHVKIRQITSEVTAIRISTQFADLRLPLKQLTGYDIDFKGDNSTVYSSFEKKEMNANAGIANSESLVAAGVTFGNKAPAAFHVKSDESAGKKTSFNITCNNCTVDFK